jgi:hypothetical protein
MRTCVLWERFRGGNALRRQAAKELGEGQTYESGEQDDNRGWHAPGHGLRVTILMAVRILFR